MTKILICDDETDTCDFVKGFFEERKCKVFSALNGFHALEILQREKPEIILLDIRMKQMNGIDTLKKIREVDKNVKVIMVTAADEEEKMAAARKLGITKYITKPLVLEDLEASVIACTKKG